MKTHLKAFLAGFISTLVFHQGCVALLHALGVFPRTPYNMDAVPPFGVPSVISLAFFGGLWGILIWFLVSKDQGKKHWIKAIVLGAVGPTAVAFLIVFPLKGMAAPIALLPIALLLNGLWGFGNSLFMKMAKG